MLGIDGIEDKDSSLKNSSKIDGDNGSHHRPLETAELGLGVGFEISSELARKVRECRGTGNARAVDVSSLTFLKAGKAKLDDEEEVNVSSPARDQGGDDERDARRDTAYGETPEPRTPTQPHRYHRVEAQLEETSESIVVSSGGDQGDEPPDTWEDYGDAPLATVSTALKGNVDLPISSSVSSNGRGNADAVSGHRESSPVEKSQHGAAEVVDGSSLSVRREPCTMPVLLVDLSRVCGFRVKAVDEAEAVRAKIRAALHQSFLERSEELFETGSASHADTRSSTQELLQRGGQSPSGSASWAAIDYPTTLEGCPVEEVWRHLTSPSESNAIETLRRALVATNRHLLWKRDMLQQIMVLASRESQEQTMVAQLEAWRTQRRDRLIRLIEIRQVFERRRATAEEKVTLAKKAGDGKQTDPVSEALIQGLDARLETIDDLIARLEIEEGEDGFGFIPSEDDEDDDDEFGDEYLGSEAGLELIRNEGEDGHNFGDKDDSEYQSQDLNHVVAEGDVPTVPTVPTDSRPLCNPVMVTRSSGKRNKQKGEKSKGQGIVKRLMEMSIHIEGEQDGLSNGDRGGREGTPAAHACSGMDEVAIDGGHAEDQIKEAAAADGVAEMSLVDAIAAMILGRYPQQAGETEEEHFAKIADMHQEIKETWLAEFGRLPPMPG